MSASAEQLRADQETRVADAARAVLVSDVTDNGGV